LFTNVSLGPNPQVQISYTKHEMTSRQKLVRELRSRAISNGNHGIETHVGTIRLKYTKLTFPHCFQNVRNEDGNDRLEERAKTPYVSKGHSKPPVDFKRDQSIGSKLAQQN
jgi:hypothetical protein